MTRKLFISCLVVLSVLLALPVVVTALPNSNNGLAIFFDTRDILLNNSINGGAFGNAQWTNATLAPWKNEPNGPGRGSGQIRFISPVINNSCQSHNLGGCNASNATNQLPIFMYMDVEDRTGTGDIISTLGLNMFIEKKAGLTGNFLKVDPANPVTVTTFNTMNTVLSGGSSSATAWDDVSAGSELTIAFDPNGRDFRVNNFRAVRIPVTFGAPTYNAALGLGVGGTFRLARFDFKGGNRGPFTTTPVGIYELKLIVNDLLIARVYDPAGPAGAAPEQPDFGYRTVSPFTPEEASVAGISGANGSSEGTTSPTFDCRIVVGPKADMNGTGTINITDITLFTGVFNAAGGGGNTVTERWRADMNCTNTINITDVTLFLTMFNCWPQTS